MRWNRGGLNRVVQPTMPHATTVRSVEPSWLSHTAWAGSIATALSDGIVEKRRKAGGLRDEEEDL